jgi:signal peptidase I
MIAPPAFRLLGVALRISPLCAGVVAVVTVLYPAVTARLVPGVGAAGAYLMAFWLGVLLLGSLLLHQVGHVAACRVAGVAVTEAVLSLPGRVEHEDPGTPRQAAIVAVGGPVVSLGVTGPCAALAVLTSGVPAALFGALAVINGVGVLAGGGRVLRAAVWAWSGSRATGDRVAGGAGRVLAMVAAVAPLPLVRADDPAGCVVLVAAGWLLAAFLWRGARESVPRQGISGWLVVGALSVAAMLLVRTFLVQSMVVTSGSMDGTLRSGDHIVVDRLSYLLGGIQRGDVVVLSKPAGVDAPEGELVKRVIGVAGDRLEARDGRVLRNGTPLDEPYLPPSCTEHAAGLAPVTVPDGQVYLLGDNRCDSLDSRSFGPVDRGLVRGRAVAVIWPLEHAGALPN